MGEEHCSAPPCPRASQRGGRGSHHTAPPHHQQAYLARQGRSVRSSEMFVAADDAKQAYRHAKDPDQPTHVQHASLQKKNFTTPARYVGEIFQYQTTLVVVVGAKTGDDGTLERHTDTQTTSLPTIYLKPQDARSPIRPAWSNPPMAMPCQPLRKCSQR